MVASYERMVNEPGKVVLIRHEASERREPQPVLQIVEVPRQL
jgi:hypothetical protein